MLRENGYCRTPEQTARFFLTTSGLKKESIGNALGSMTDERGLESLKLFAEGIGMEGLPFVRSLRKVSERSGAGGGGIEGDEQSYESRKLTNNYTIPLNLQFASLRSVQFLAKFKMPGEAQMVDRVLDAFANAFFKQNPDEFSSPTAAHGLSFSVIMLNTDAHSRSLKASKKMTKPQFIKNCSGIDYQKEFTKDMLGKIFDDIIGQEILHQVDKHDDGNLFADSVKEGWMKKQGAKAPYTWKKRYFILSRSPPQMYYFEDEKSADPIGYIPLDNDIIVGKR